MAQRYVERQPPSNSTIRWDWLTRSASIYIFCALTSNSNTAPRWVGNTRWAIHGIRVEKIHAFSVAIASVGEDPRPRLDDMVNIQVSSTYHKLTFQENTDHQSKYTFNLNTNIPSCEYIQRRSHYNQSRIVAHAGRQ